MTVTLQLTNGTDTVDLNGANGTGTGAILKRGGYIPLPPKKGETTVEERARIRFVDTSLSALKATVNKAERLLYEAERWEANETGARVYLKYRADGSLTLLRARIYRGSKTPDSDTLAAPLANSRWLCEFAWTRGPWEADTQTELTSGATALTNHDDAGHDNLLDFTVTPFAAFTAPSPLYMEMANTSGQTIGRVYIGFNAFAGTAMPLTLLEGESFVGMTADVGATNTGGSFGRYDLSGTASQEVGRYTISAANMAKFAGHAFRLLLRGGTYSPDAVSYMYAALCPVGSSVAFASTSEVSTYVGSHELHDLGILPFGSVPAVTALQAADLVLYGRGTNTDTIYVDYVALMPLDAWAIVDGVIANGSTLILDSSTMTAVVSDGSSNQIGTLAVDGMPLMAQPNRAHRVIVLWERSDGTSVIADTCTLRVYVRGAYKTL